VDGHESPGAIVIDGKISQSGLWRQRRRQTAALQDAQDAATAAFVRTHNAFRSHSKQKKQKNAKKNRL